MIAINMSTSWDWKTNISEVAINKTVALQTGNSVPNVESAVLFHGAPDDTQIYLYGGVTPTINKSYPYWQWPTTNQYTLWGFDTDSYAWTQYDIFSTIPERPSWGAFAEAPDQGLAFYLNGMITNWSSPSTSYLGGTSVFLGGMVVLDLKNQTATNISTDVITDGYSRVRGGMIYIPGLASKGVLATVGGATGSSSNLNLVNMNQINIFDVAAAFGTVSSSSSDGWYTQTITGTVPDPRVDFCMVLASAPDNSSYNVYMYGGWDPTQSNKYFDEIWVLSLPSFSWVQIYTGTSPRFGHSCHAVGNRQMITIGGLDNVNATDYCDWEFMSVAIYDLTEGSSVGWGSIFSTDKAPYQVTAQISAAIGGGPNGNATKLLPDGGWSSTLVANLFTGTSNQTAPVGISSSSTVPKSAASSTAPAKSTHAEVAEIAGGVVGGVAAVILISSLGFFFVRHCSESAKKLKQNSQQQYSKSELESLGKVKSDSHPPDVADKPIELPPSLHQTRSEAGGNARSELSGRQLLAEVEGCEIHEKN